MSAGLNDTNFSNFGGSSNSFSNTNNNGGGGNSTSYDNANTLGVLKYGFWVYTVPTIPYGSSPPDRFAKWKRFFMWIDRNSIFMGEEEGKPLPFLCGGGGDGNEYRGEISLRSVMKIERYDPKEFRQKKYGDSLADSLSSPKKNSNATSSSSSFDAPPAMLSNYAWILTTDEFTAVFVSDSEYQRSIWVDGIHFLVFGSAPAVSHLKNRSGKRKKMGSTTNKSSNNEDDDEDESMMYGKLDSLYPSINCGRSRDDDNDATTTRTASVSLPPPPPSTIAAGNRFTAATVAASSPPPTSSSSSPAYQYLPPSSVAASSALNNNDDVVIATPPSNPSMGDCNKNNNDSRSNSFHVRDVSSASDYVTSPTIMMAKGSSGGGRGSVAGVGAGAAAKTNNYPSNVTAMPIIPSMATSSQQQQHMDPVPSPRTSSLPPLRPLPSDAAASPSPYSSPQQPARPSSTSQQRGNSGGAGTNFAVNPQHGGGGGSKGNGGSSSNGGDGGGGGALVVSNSPATPPPPSAASMASATNPSSLQLTTVSNNANNSRALAVAAPPSSSSSPSSPSSSLSAFQLAAQQRLINEAMDVVAMGTWVFKVQGDDAEKEKKGGIFGGGSVTWNTRFMWMEGASGFGLGGAGVGPRQMERGDSLGATSSSCSTLFYGEKKGDRRGIVHVNQCIAVDKLSEEELKSYRPPAELAKTVANPLNFYKYGLRLRAPHGKAWVFACMSEVETIGWFNVWKKRIPLSPDEIARGVQQTYEEDAKAQEFFLQKSREADAKRKEEAAKKKREEEQFKQTFEMMAATMFAQQQAKEEAERKEKAEKERIAKEQVQEFMKMQLEMEKVKQQKAKEDAKRKAEENEKKRLEDQLKAMLQKQQMEMEVQRLVAEQRQKDLELQQKLVEQELEKRTLEMKMQLLEEDRARKKKLADEAIAAALEKKRKEEEKQRLQRELEEDQRRIDEVHAEFLARQKKDTGGCCVIQ